MTTFAIKNNDIKFLVGVSTQVRPATEFGKDTQKTSVHNSAPLWSVRGGLLLADGSALEGVSIKVASKTAPAVSPATFYDLSGGDLFLTPYASDAGRVGFSFEFVGALKPLTIDKAPFPGGDK